MKASSNGGSAIKEYDVDISPGGIVRTVTGTSYVWTGLTNGAVTTTNHPTIPTGQVISQSPASG